MEGLEAFLRTLAPLHLADADGGTAWLPKDSQVVSHGKEVFARNCARCHSSKQPPQDYKGDRAAWFLHAVMQDDFLTGNFLSDDVRYPVSELGTNIERAEPRWMRAGDTAKCAIEGIGTQIHQVVAEPAAGSTN